MMHEKHDLLVRSLQLAKLGLGKTGNTPLGGWILINDQTKILSEGWLPNLPILSNLTVVENPRRSSSEGITLIVNQLNNATPELIEKLHQFSIRKLLVAAPLADHLKNKIQKANIKVQDKLVPDDESFLNRRYYTFQSQQRPFIILKWAETADGFVARKNYDSKWISNALSRRLVHKWRSEEDAILVGTNTAHYDNPRLNVRNWSGRDPLRIVIDKNLRLDSQLFLFDNSQPTICYNLLTDKQEEKNEWVRISETEPSAFFEAVLRNLYQRNIHSLIIEGGSQLLHFLIEQQLWDEARVFTADACFQEGIIAPKLTDAKLSFTNPINNDQLRVYQKLNRK